MIKKDALKCVLATIALVFTFGLWPSGWKFLRRPHLTLRLTENHFELRFQGSFRYVGELSELDFYLRGDDQVIFKLPGHRGAGLGNLGREDNELLSEFIKTLDSRLNR